MSIENSSHDHRAPHEVIGARWYIPIACANIIDKIGQVYEDDEGVYWCAEWKDEAAKRRFTLVMSQSPVPSESPKGSDNATQHFTLFVIDYETGERVCRSYKSDERDITAGAEPFWPFSQDPDDPDVIVVSYLNAAPLTPLSSDEQQKFHGIVARTTLEGDQFRRKLAWASRFARIKLANGSINHLVEDVQAKEPLLSEEEIRRAIWAHLHNDDT